MPFIHSSRSFTESFCAGYVDIKLNQHLIQNILKNIPANYDGLHFTENALLTDFTLYLLRSLYLLQIFIIASKIVLSNVKILEQDLPVFNSSFFPPLISVTLNQLYDFGSPFCLPKNEGSDNNQKGCDIRIQVKSRRIASYVEVRFYCQSLREIKKKISLSKTYLCRGGTLTFSIKENG